MAKFSFKTKIIPGGKAIGAVTETGEVIAEFFKTTTRTPRTGATSYDAHRISKGDCFETEDHFEFVGNHAAVLAAAESQLPKALIDAKWAVGFKRDDWAVFNFLEGLAGGCCWYGNTPAKVVSAAKRARTNLSFEV